ncbi:MAG: hypothetical protein ACYTEQ_20630 [Planctomycetota bacterium]|jgi:hypothetical protein
MQLQLRESLDWLDSKPSWQFLAVLYVARWVLIVPCMLAAGFLFTDAQLDARGFAQALLATSIFYGTINIVGWSGIILRDAL